MWYRSRTATVTLSAPSLVLLTTAHIFHIKTKPVHRSSVSRPQYSSLPRSCSLVLAPRLALICWARMRLFWSMWRPGRHFQFIILAFLFPSPSSSCSALPCAMSLVLYIEILFSLALSLSSRLLSIPRLDTISSTASRLLRWLEAAERLTRPAISSSPERSCTFDPEMLRTLRHEASARQLRGSITKCSPGRSSWRSTWSSWNKVSSL